MIYWKGTCPLLLQALIMLTNPAVVGAILKGLTQIPDLEEQCFPAGCSWLQSLHHVLLDLFVHQVFSLKPTHLVGLEYCGKVATNRLGAAQLETGIGYSMGCFQSTVKTIPWRLALRQSSSRLITSRLLLLVIFHCWHSKVTSPICEAKICCSCSRPLLTMSSRGPRQRASAWFGTCQS